MTANLFNRLILIPGTVPNLLLIRLFVYFNFDREDCALNNFKTLFQSNLGFNSSFIILISLKILIGNLSASLIEILS